MFNVARSRYERSVENYIAQVLSQTNATAAPQKMTNVSIPAGMIGWYRGTRRERLESAFLAR